MAQNFLYMFEFVIDDLLITHPNECAPEEYPTCCEITFRSSVYVSICDQDFGGCLDSQANSKSGKCCLFSLESPIKRDDELNVHIYKKRIEKCKFLLGTTSISVQSLFDKTTSEFLEENPLLTEKKSKKTGTAGAPASYNDLKVDNTSLSGMEKNPDKVIRQEEFCPSSVIEKKLLSLFDLNGKQTGNLVLVIRLSCMGPTIVSPFPFSKYRGNSTRASSSPYRQQLPCCQQEVVDTKCCVALPPTTQTPKLCCSEPVSKCRKKKCCNYEPTTQCCEPAEAECEADEESSEVSEVSSVYPCYICPSQKEPGPEAYDEFEANLNGSGMVVRVLKNSHHVQSVVDSDYASDEGHCNCKNRNSHKNDYAGGECNSKDFYRSTYVKNLINARVGGKFQNEKGLPRIRGNIKYAGNEICSQNFELPMPPIKECDSSNVLNEKIRKYRKNDMLPLRNCCLQVQGTDIDKTLQGLNSNKKNGIEICHQKCVETDADVFLLKLGKKQKCKHKQNIVEIELKTPKCPTIVANQKHSRETQIDEVELDAELKDICGKKKKNKKRR